MTINELMSYPVLEREIVRRMRELMTDAIIIDISVYDGDAFVPLHVHERYLVVNDFDYDNGKNHLVFISRVSGTSHTSMFNKNLRYYKVHHIEELVDYLGGKRNDYNRII